MRRLSAVAEIDSGSLYEYIGSKETLLWDLVGGVFDEAAEYVTRRSMVHAQWSASKAIRAFSDWGDGRREALAIAVRDGHCLGDTRRHALDASRARLISRLATALEAELVDADKTVSSVVGAEMLMALAHAAARDKSATLTADTCRRLALNALGLKFTSRNASRRRNVVDYDCVMLDVAPIDPRGEVAALGVGCADHDRRRHRRRGGRGRHARTAGGVVAAGVPATATARDRAGRRRRGPT